MDSSKRNQHGGQLQPGTSSPRGPAGPPSLVHLLNPSLHFRLLTQIWAPDLNLLFFSESCLSFPFCLNVAELPWPGPKAATLRHLLQLQTFYCRTSTFPEPRSKHHLFPSRPAAVLKTHPPLPARITNLDLTVGQVPFHTGVISLPHTWFSMSSWDQDGLRQYLSLFILRASENHRTFILIQYNLM